MKVIQKIINLLPIACFLVNIKSNKIVLINKKALELTNLDEESLKKCKISNFINTSILKFGEYEKFDFKIKQNLILKGNLSIKYYNQEYTIVTFYETNTCWQENTIQSSASQQETKCDSQLRDLIDKSVDSIFIMRNGIIIYANPKLIETSGYLPENLIDKNYTDFVVTTELNKINKYFSKHNLKKKMPMIYESIVKTQCGNSIEVEVNVINIVYNSIAAQQVILRDITAKKKAERKYRNIIDFAPIGFYQSSRNGDFLIANNELASMLGFESNKDLISKNISDFYYSKKERETLIAKYDGVKKYNVKNIEVKFRKKDGSPIWVLMTSKAIKDKNHITQYYDGFLIDISDRKETELGLLQKEYALASSINAIGITDLKGNMLYANNATEKMWGYTKGEIIGKPLTDFWQGNGIQKTMQDLKEKGYSFGEDIGKKKDGTLFNVQYSASIVPDSEGNPINLFASFIDITERKIYEQEIARLYKAVDQSPSPVALTNLNGEFIYVNPRYCDLSGYSKTEFIGAHTRILKSGKHSKNFYHQLWETILSGKIWTGEIINRKKNGELFIESAKISPVHNDSGIVTHYIKVSNDVTNEKRIKDELIKSKEKAEESDRLKSAFLANMSHEIRTPMNGILGFLDLLREPHLKDEQKEEYIKIINQSGERMLNTLSDIVEISKIEAGVVEIKNVSVNINECITDILNFFEPQAQKKGLELNFEENISRKKININTDIGKFQSILTNLIKNAIKYTKKGNICINYQIKASFIEFKITDTGIGISKYRQKAIFNRFEQADIDDKMVLEGSGLGLAIAKSYVKMLGGEIWLESIEGKGSQFYFTIPFFCENNPYKIKI